MMSSASACCCLCFWQLQLFAFIGKVEVKGDKWGLVRSFRSILDSSPKVPVFGIPSKVSNCLARKQISRAKKLAAKWPPPASNTFRVNCLFASLRPSLFFCAVFHKSFLIRLNSRRQINKFDNFSSANQIVLGGKTSSGGGKLCAENNLEKPKSYIFMFGA